MSPEVSSDPVLATERPQRARRPRSRSTRCAGCGTSKTFHGSITFLAFVVVFVVYIVWLGDKFASTDARLLDVHQNAPVLLLGLAVLVTLVAGQFDLSVGSMATLTTYLAIGLKLNENWPFGLVIVVLPRGRARRWPVNGFLVVRLRVNAFIATLGTGGLFLGLSSVYGKGTSSARAGGPSAARLVHRSGLPRAPSSTTSRPGCCGSRWPRRRSAPSWRCAARGPRADRRGPGTCSQSSSSWWSPSC